VHEIQNHGDEHAESLLAARLGICFFHTNGEEAFPDWSS
jgi:hypothetical protein